MFKKLASEALGLSDIGTIVQPRDYGSVDADDYLFHEDGEKIFFLIKSRKDEYCFTNLALIHVDGDSAVSSKRTIKRHDYADSVIERVTIETAGTVDMDVELKFSIGGTAFSIDVRKQFLEQLKDVYKALIAIGRLQARDEESRSNAFKVLGAMSSMYRIGQVGLPRDLPDQFNALLDNLNEAVLVRHARRDFGEVFGRYIHA
ncbi:MAG: PH domain-containing protein [Sphaerotilus natans]